MAKSIDRAYEAARGNARLRIEQWAQNPTCVANTISVVRNVRMADVALSVGLQPTFGQSPFAIIRGQQFESTLLKDNAAILIGELQKHKVLPSGGCSYRDLRTRTNGGRLSSLDEAVAESKAVLVEAVKLAQTQKFTPVLCAGFTLKVPKGILLPEAILIIDILVITRVNGKPVITVGEVKTYPDRGGHTDASELATARAQAGMYVHGLDLVVQELKLVDSLTVSRNGILILTRPGSNQPSIRANEDLRYQALRAERGFKMLEDSAMSLGSDLWAEIGKAPPEKLVSSILKAPKSYCEGCLTFCDLAPNCFEQARLAGDPVILGENAKRILGEIELGRAISLLAGGKPLSVREVELVESYNALMEDFQQ